MDLDGRQPEKLKKPYPAFSLATAHHLTRTTLPAQRSGFYKALHLTEATPPSNHSISSLYGLDFATV